MRKTIFLFIDWFDPAYKAGGPIRSCVNFVNYLQSDYDIYVFTSNHDLNKTDILKGLEYDTWLFYNDSVKIFYASPRSLNFQTLTNELRNINPDFIYINSVFSVYFSIYPLLIKRIKKLRGKIILSPRGMLRPSALAIKPAKKRLFLTAFKKMGFHQTVRFHATDTGEANDIKLCFGETQIGIVPNLPQTLLRQSPPISKLPGELLLIFVGRIHPIKNLHFLIELLNSVKGKVTLTVVGIAEDDEYLNLCKSLANSLPEGKKVIFEGDMPHKKIQQLLYNHHLFVLPTQGENFGHAIFEALSAGRPVLISDQTPWINLAAEYAGWDIPLADKDEFIRKIDQAVSMDQPEFDKWSAGAFAYSSKFLASSDFLSGYKLLFQ